jgi:hypothetical protein
MTRRAAIWIWGALLVVPVAFAPVAFRAASASPIPEARAPLLWAALSASFVNLALAWRLPPRLGPPRALDRDAVAFARAAVSLALGEAAVLAPLVAYVLHPDRWLLAIAAADLVALAALYPSARRWEALRPEAGLAPLPLPEAR